MADEKFPKEEGGMLVTSDGLRWAMAAKKRATAHERAISKKGKK